jgi:hypothetical protein
VNQITADLLLAAPAACAFLLLVEKSGVSVEEAVRPPLALELAAKALYVLDPWSGRHDAVVEHVIRAAGSLDVLAAEIVQALDTGWWFEPLDRRSQLWLGTSWDSAPVVAPLVSDPHFAAMMQLPRSWLTTSTAYQGRSAVHALLAQQAGDWDPAYPLPARAVQVDDAARVLELNTPKDWHRLATSYAQEAAARPSSDKAREVVPDWTGVASDWDGIHLTFGGFLLSVFVKETHGKAVTQLWRWESESTLWLRDVFVSQTDLAPLAACPAKVMHLGRLPGLL